MSKPSALSTAPHKIMITYMAVKRTIAHFCPITAVRNAAKMIQLHSVIF